MVTGFICRHFALQLLAGGVKIAKRVKNLVTDEFVVVTKTFFIHDFVARKDNGVIKRTAPCKAHRPHGFDFVQEAESPCTGDIGNKHAIVEFDRHALIVDCLAGEIDFEIDLKAMPRFDPRGAALVFDFNRFQNLNYLTRCILFLNPDAIDQEVERCRTAIHNRHFVGINVDQNVVDALPRKGCHQMFDGANLDPGTPVTKAGAKLRIDHTIVTCRKQRLAIQIRAAEYDTVIFRCRVQGDADFMT